MQEKYKAILINSKLWKLLTVISFEVLFAIGAVYLWNWIISNEVNRLIFGTPELGVLKGVILIIFLDMTNELLKDYKTN